MVADIKPLKNVIGLAEPSWAVHADFYRYIEKTRFARFTLARNEKSCWMPLEFAWVPTAAEDRGTRPSVRVYGRETP